MALLEQDQPYLCEGRVRSVNIVLLKPIPVATARASFGISTSFGIADNPGVVNASNDESGQSRDAGYLDSGQCLIRPNIICVLEICI